MGRVEVAITINGIYRQARSFTSTEKALTFAERERKWLLSREYRE